MGRDCGSIKVTRHCRVPTLSPTGRAEEKCALASTFFQRDGAALRTPLPRFRRHRPPSAARSRGPASSGSASPPKIQNHVGKVGGQGLLLSQPFVDPPIYFIGYWKQTVEKITGRVAMQDCWKRAESGEGQNAWALPMRTITRNNVEEPTIFVVAISVA